MINLFDSIKLKLYDTYTTSFMGSFVVSWILINHKYLLIYFSDVKDLETKLTYLDFQCITIETTLYQPFSIAIFYTLIFPFFNIFLLKATEWFKNKYRNIKIEAADKKVLTEDEQKLLLDEIYNLKNQLLDKNKVVATLTTDSLKNVIEKESIISEKNKKIISLENKNSEINKNKIELIKNLEQKIIDNDIITKETIKIKDDFNRYKESSKKLLMEVDKSKREKDILYEEFQKMKNENNELNKIKLKLKESILKLSNADETIKEYAEKEKLIMKKENDCIKIKNENTKLHNILTINNISSEFDNEDKLSKNEIEVLKAINKSDYKENKYLRDFISMIMELINKPRLLTESIIKSLIDKRILSKDGSFLKITDTGKKLILKITNNISE